MKVEDQADEETARLTRAGLKLTEPSYWVCIERIKSLRNHLLCSLVTIVVLLLFLGMLFSSTPRDSIGDDSKKDQLFDDDRISSENNDHIGINSEVDVDEQDYFLQDNFNKLKNNQQEFTLQRYSSICLKAKSKNFSPDSNDYRIYAASCGWGYNFTESLSIRNPWRILLYGRFSDFFKTLFGVPEKCILSPSCEITSSSINIHMLRAGNYNLVVLEQDTAEKFIHEIPDFNREGEKIIKILYWREASHKYVHIENQRKFDFEIGIHYHAAMLNPLFLRTPMELLSMSIHPYPPLEFVPPERRDKLAISIISDCHASSLRGEYEVKLNHYLNGRVDRFGRCAKRPLPGNLLSNQAKLISQYKFYFAFENTIQDGYVTEKLFFTLNIPVIPVYYGCLNVPNVTKTPSFIKASDFSSPKSLADYLLFIDTNNQEFMKFHEWRWNPQLFEEEYLHRLTFGAAGPDEQLTYLNVSNGSNRYAQFCRLCNEKEVKRLASLPRDPRSFINPAMTLNQIRKKFFRD